MTRTILALVIAAATTLPTAAAAATYVAKPLSPVAAKRIVGRDIAWSCAPSECRGRTENSRPLILCQGLAKKAGRLASFAVDGRALAGADLEKCNTAARDRAPVLARAD